MAGRLKARIDFLNKKLGWCAIMGREILPDATNIIGVNKNLDDLIAHIEKTRPHMKIILSEGVKHTKKLTKKLVKKK